MRLLQSTVLCVAHARDPEDLLSAGSGETAEQQTMEHRVDQALGAYQGILAAAVVRQGGQLCSQGAHVVMPTKQAAEASHHHLHVPMRHS